MATLSFVYFFFYICTPSPRLPLYIRKSRSSSSLSEIFEKKRRRGCSLVIRLSGAAQSCQLLSTFHIVLFLLCRYDHISERKEKVIKSLLFFFSRISSRLDRRERIDIKSGISGSIIVIPRIVYKEDTQEEDRISHRS